MIIENEQSKMTKQDLTKAFFRSQLLMATSNFERMQALGAYYSIVPTLKKIYGDKPKEERVAAIKRHLEFFNTNPYVYGPILGITMAMEEQTPEDQKESVIAVKTGLMGPFAGLGDSLLAMTVVPIYMSIASGLAIEGNPIGPILFFILFSLTIWPLKYKGIFMGYEKGSALLTGENGNKMLKRLATMGNVVGMMVVGSLIVSTVKINIPIEYTVGESTIKIQEMLDGIMPNFFPLLITLLVYYLLKKRNAKNAVAIIVSIMVIGIFLSIIGILA
ncbi:TPA: PTS system mannose/fructose/sorbose family transporter subunit IID [Enterococcus faecium]|jgi:PTS system mannose-specific IID component|uniref:PTS system mannose/fructose/sorbose family transporter subunit IID n=1 Tax=Enterococcus faecium TaxID=1352 RepID=A0A200IUM6_ENTFC|nr:MULTISPECIES: PTS system mannose/fructose/sorbose family transporter subunit IID [Enterococcus]EEV49157.1 PTS system IID component [Enterococcus faecium 1,231,501]EGP4971555.1 PTS system mannose/fructose/sorbose family transporter subunit IID [Enterococcus faecium]EGP4985941.1 PTS system mannose/fructose/sorbose family transporter subunit IID [Enterococcus faecium]EGP4990659.1 PTS system mannose/fructose/sorbose family transporter subunit IID [Enterococcus faecium]EGP5088597.1 PTS system ma